MIPSTSVRRRWHSRSPSSPEAAEAISRRLDTLANLSMGMLSPPVAAGAGAARSLWPQVVKLAVRPPVRLVAVRLEEPASAAIAEPRLPVAGRPGMRLLARYADDEPCRRRLRFPTRPVRPHGTARISEVPAPLSGPRQQPTCVTWFTLPRSTPRHLLHQLGPQAHHAAPFGAAVIFNARHRLRLPVRACGGSERRQGRSEPTGNPRCLPGQTA